MQMTVTCKEEVDLFEDIVGSLFPKWPEEIKKDIEISRNILGCPVVRFSEFNQTHDLMFCKDTTELDKVWFNPKDKKTTVNLFVETKSNGQQEVCVEVVSTYDETVSITFFSRQWSNDKNNVVT